MSTYLYSAFDCVFGHLRYVFQKQSHSINVKQILVQNKRDI